MFDTPAASVTVEVAVKQLADALDTLLAVDLTGASRDELLDLAGGLETQRRRLPTADHALIGELETRAVAGQLACASTAALLMQLLRITPAEAKARVRAATDLGPRRTLTGDALPPVFPAVAAAQAEGAISDRHAAVIRHTVHALPAAADQVEQVEQALTDQALRLDPDQLARAGQRLLDCLDPDGTLADEKDHQRHRHATLTARRDGSGRLEAYLTPAALAKCQAVLDPLAAPHPAADGTPDPRTAGQRLHDAVEEAADRLLRAGDLPDCGGTPATVLVTLTLSDLLKGPGPPPPTTAAPSAWRRRCGWPPKARSSPSCSTTVAGSWPTAAAAASPPRSNASPWPPATADAPSQGATDRRTGAKAITSCPGSTAGPPISTI